MMLSLASLGLCTSCLSLSFDLPAKLLLVMSPRLGRSLFSWFPRNLVLTTLGVLSFLNFSLKRIKKAEILKAKNTSEVPILLFHVNEGLLDRLTRLG